MSDKNIPELSSVSSEPKEESSIIDFQAKRVQKRGEKPPEAVDEDMLLAKMKAASLVLGARQERSWNTIRDLSGGLLMEDDEGEKRFRDLCIPRKKLDSQRATINQLRGLIQRAIKDGAIHEPDDIVPWFVTEDEEENEYTKQLTFLKSHDAEKIVKEYTPLVEQIESFTDEVARKKFFDSLDERTSVVVDLLQRIRQIRHDHSVFLQLFHEEKNPAFLKAFAERAGVERKKSVRISKEKRARMRIREQSKQEVHPGAQMTIKLHYEGAEIVFRRDRSGLTLERIADPKRILPEQGRQAIIGGQFSFDLHDAPHWLKEIAQEKGLI